MWRDSDVQPWEPVPKILPTERLPEFIGIEFNEWDEPVCDHTTYQSTLPGVFFGGDAAFGPENIIWAVEHGHQAAVADASDEVRAAGRGRRNAQRTR